MHLNCLPNYCCYSNFCNCPSLCIPTSIGSPPNCCCCLICRQPNKLKLARMPIRPKLSNGAAAAAANKTVSKSKSKTMRSKKMTRTSKQEDQNDNHQNGTGLNSSSTSLKTSESSCRFNCFRTQSKQKLNINNSYPKNQEDKSSVLSDSTRRSYSSRSHTSDQSRRELIPENIINRPRQALDESSLGTKMQMNARSSRDQPTRKCNCCLKPLPMYLSSPNTSRHSFVGAKTRSQLDVIDEVDSDAENNRRQCGSADNYAAMNNFWHNMAAAENVRRPSSPPTSQAHKTKVHKSLEDSCADFLSIVCDNIMECVQKSIDGKLTEFIVRATEKFTSLTQKLEENETAMTKMVQAQAANLNEQLKSNFEEFYLRLRNLMEKQNQTGVSETNDKECQLAGTEEKPEEHSITPEQLSHNGRDGGSSLVEQLSRNTLDTSDDQGHIAKCPSCDCCLEEENSCHPCTPNEMQNDPLLNRDSQSRESGGGSCFDGAETRRTNEKKEVKLGKTAEEFCPPPNSAKETNLRLATSDKINCFCDSFSHSHNWSGNKLKDHDACGHRDTDLNLNVYDNYETSGYATEPEDNSEANNIKSGRKRLHKKSVRQHNLNRQTSAANNLDDVHDMQLNEASEMSSTQTITILSRSSLRSCDSSPTRLSRL